MAKIFAIFEAACVLIAWGMHTPALATNYAFVDPLDAPAVEAPNPTSQPLIAITVAGAHLVAVGPRGLIVTSDTTGHIWHQSSVPVQSDLVAVQFLDVRNGWACGHDDVILHSTDGGLTWTKQLDGISARSVFESNYNQRIAAGNSDFSSDLQEIHENFDQGPALPWLGIWFTNAETGYAVGPFGDLAYTQDGGKTWEPWLDHIDNPNFYDLNAIGTAGHELFIVGEQGMVYALDPSRQKFVARPTGYAGSLFGLVGNAKTLLVYGLRGTIFRSEDQGKTWVQSKNAANSSIMYGTLMPDGHFVLVTVDGLVLVSRDDGLSFQSSAAAQNSPLSGVAVSGAGQPIMTSLGGIRYSSGG